MYLELHAASAFSFLEGASLPDALVARAAALDHPAIALLDRDGVYGAPRLHQAARKAGLRALVGAELTMQSGQGPVTAREGAPQDVCGRCGADRRRGACACAPGVPRADILRQPLLWRLPVLVESAAGYRALCRLVTRMKLAAQKGQGTLTLEELDGHVEGLVALVGRPALAADRHGVGGLMDRLVGIFGRRNVCVEVQRHLTRDEAADMRTLQSLAEAFRVPMVATNGVRFASPDDRPLYDVLTCIRHGTTLAQAGRRLAVNAERYLKSPQQMAALFRDLPSALHATRDLGDRLEFTLANLGYRFPDYPVPADDTQMGFLRRLADVGARWRYRPYHERAQRQVARELDLIEKLDLAGYFLIVWDLVNYCRQHDILVQGRGSAANSAVCYSLGITAVDPVGMELLFERFLSEERGEWPDIDLDLPSGARREQVIQYVYERYGPRGAAMTANVITYRGRSAAREVGKVLGCPPPLIEYLAKHVSPFEWKDPADTMARHLRDAGVNVSDPTIRHFADLWVRMQDVPRHLGQHSGGMVVCRGRLDEVVPLENASMPGRVVVQWDKDDCADLGIVKVDLLGLGMMAVLQEAITVINAEASPEASVVDLAHLPPDDPAVYRMLQEADTVGLFQVESRAQMATLPRLKPTTFYDIVVEVALIRPGPIVGQMVHPYLRRRKGEEAVTYAHPSLEPILKRTLGVPLFQEQLLRMAMAVAGFTGGEAEELRRAMGFKRSEARMRAIETRLRDGMAANGITGAQADAIVLSITSFALYGFPESHAASFALLVYASAYLKAHYPAAFYTALLNNQPLGFYHPATLIKDAQRHGVRFRPVDVQVSDWPCTIEADGAVRLGLRMVQGLREEVGRRVQSKCKGERRKEKEREKGKGGSAKEEGQREERREERGMARQDDEARSMRDRTRRTTPGSCRPRLAETGRNTHVANIEVPPTCPKCGNDDASMCEVEERGGMRQCYCSICAHDWVLPLHAQSGETPMEPTAETGEVRRFWSIDELVAVTGIRRDELNRLASLGALNTLGYDRRAALWDVERAVRPSGLLFAGSDASGSHASGSHASGRDASGGDASGRDASGRDASPRRPSPATGRDGAPSRPPTLSRPPLPGRPTDVAEPADARVSPGHPGDIDAAEAIHTEGDGEPGRCPGPVRSPLPPMTPLERLVADYEGSGVTIGPHPMSLRRRDLALRGVLRSDELAGARAGRRVRVAGAVITRQRPGTAKGMVFLTLEDEVGLANVIVRPDVFDRQRALIVESPFLLVEGVLQQQEGVTAVRAERVTGLPAHEPSVPSHDFR